MSRSRKLTEEDIRQISSFLEENLHDLLKNYTSYSLSYTETEYITKNGKKGKDYSGQLEKITAKNVDETIDSIDFSLEDFLGNIYFNNWRPSHEPGRGKEWESFLDEFYFRYNVWSHDRFATQEEKDEGFDLEDEVYNAVHEEYYRFCEEVNVEKYIGIIKRSLKL